MRRILSGIQPSGVPTIGNYLGALRHWVSLQEANECLYCVVDLHAITVPQDPAALRRQVRQTASVLLACGVDPSRAVLFNQAAVSAHARLAWVLNCVCRMGWLNRMTQFKDKAGKDRESASVGLFDYPVLMAADVLAYRATAVPVGDDQRQHLELTNDIGQKFNHDYASGFFPAVEALVAGQASRIMSLRDGSKKMSKSDPSEQSRIELTDGDDDIALKIRRARTDPDALPSERAGLEGRPEARNLVEIMAAVTGRDVDAVLSQHGGTGFSAFKEALAAAVIELVSPIRSQSLRLMADEAHVDAVLRAGAERARAIADPIVGDAERAVGLLV